MNSACWTLVYNAADGDRSAREMFGIRYAPVIRAYLAARWSGSPYMCDLDDAIQEAFVECIRAGGILDRVESDRPGGFRAFLYGAVRNVALRFEERRARRNVRQAAQDVEWGELPGRNESLSKVFDRALASAIMREAAEYQTTLAARSGDAAVRRVELLKLRFQEGLPIRDIATLWGVDAADLHRQFARARNEFREALREVVALHLPASPEHLDAKCAELLQLLD